MASAAYSINFGGASSHHHHHHHGNMTSSGGESGGRGSRRSGRNARRGRSQASDPDATDGEGSGGCCANVECFHKCNGGSGEKCTAAKVKSCLKMFLARLFSHVGLCALVIGYALMGAAIFKFLEKDNEMETRGRVAESRLMTLDQLYNITGNVNSSPLSVSLF